MNFYLCANITCLIVTTSMLALSLSLHLTGTVIRALS